jgi:hypothetical protein
MAANEIEDARRLAANAVAGRPGLNTPGRPRPTGGGGLNTTQGSGAGGRELTPAELAATPEGQASIRNPPGSSASYVGGDKPGAANFKISSFRNVLSKYGGIQKTNLFTVTIKNAIDYVPKGFDTKDLVFLCNRVVLPGVGFYASNEYKRYGVGVSEKVPYNVTFDDTQLSFLGDSRGYILNFFETWTNSIVSYASAHDLSAKQQMLNNGSLWEPGEIAYKKSYQKEIVIELYDTSARNVTQYTLYKAFPLVVQGNNLSWASVDDAIEIDTIFSFMNWSSKNYADVNQVGSQLPGLSFIQKALKLGSMAAAFGAIGVPNSVADVIQIVNTTNIIGLNSRNSL